MNMTDIQHKSQRLTPGVIWTGLLLGCLALELAALYFQYGLDYGPCILCVQIRAILGLIGVIALLALVLPISVEKILSLSLLPLSIGYTWLCYQVLGIERGWFEGSCTFEPPFPSWFALHEWLPSIFEAWELCGYTPEIVFNITMAETLIAVAVIIMLANILLIKKLFTDT